MTNLAKLNETRTRYNAYIAAEEAVLTGQEYRIGTRLLRRPDLIEIRKMIDRLYTEIQELTAQMEGKARRLQGSYTLVD